VLALTKDGLEVLERHWAEDREDDEDRQEFYAGVVKPRELAHDAQLYRLFQTERDELESEGASVTHVALDFELKRDYHQYVEERVREGADRDEARREFAEEHDLPFRSKQTQLPDLRVEYETPDGQRGYRDLELATESYSRTQLAGKHFAGFRVYRAAGARLGSSSSRGGTPSDPHHLEWLR